MSFGASPFASSPFADAGTEKYEIGAVGITTSSPVVDNANITAGNVFVGLGITLGARRSMALLWVVLILFNGTVIMKSF